MYFPIKSVHMRQIFIFVPLSMAYICVCWFRSNLISFEWSSPVLFATTFSYLDDLHQFANTTRTAVILRRNIPWVRFIEIILTCIMNSSHQALKVTDTFNLKIVSETQLHWRLITFSFLGGFSVFSKWK